MAFPAGSIVVLLFDAKDIPWSGEGYTNHQLRRAIETATNSPSGRIYKLEFATIRDGRQTVTLTTGPNDSYRITVQLYGSDGEQCILPPPRASELTDTIWYPKVNLVIAKLNGDFTEVECRKSRALVTHSTRTMVSLRNLLLSYLHELPATD